SMMTWVVAPLSATSLLVALLALLAWARSYLGVRSVRPWNEMDPTERTNPRRQSHHISGARRADVSIRRTNWLVEFSRVALVHREAARHWRRAELEGVLSTARLRVRQGG